MRVSRIRKAATGVKRSTKSTTDPRARHPSVPSERAKKKQPFRGCFFVWTGR